MQVTRIDEALSGYFEEQRVEPAGPVDMQLNPDVPQGPAYRKCPACGLDMMPRRKKDATKAIYFSCMGFPDCKMAVWLPTTVQQVEVHPTTCPRVLFIHLFTF